MMNDELVWLFEQIGAAVSIALMGLCAARLALRFLRVLKGGERADGLAPERAYAPVSHLMAVAGAALAARILAYLIAYAMYRLLRVGGDGFWASLEPLWTHWDVRHYTGIAQEWYTSVGDERLRLVFFPLYPLLMRLFAPLAGGDVFWAGTVISLLSACLAAALLYDLAYMHFGAGSARLAAAYFLLSPLSVFLGCVYTESLFICLTLAAVCLYRRGRPYAAAVCGALSAFTRMPGVIMSGLMIIGFLQGAAKKRPQLRDVLACSVQVLIVFCGLFAYWAVNWAVTGDPMTYLVYQSENWYQEAGSFWGSTANTVHYFLTSVGESDWLWTWGFQLLCMGAIYVLLAFCANTIPFDLAAYSFVYTAVVLSPTWLLSGARYLYAMCTLPLLLTRLRLGEKGHGVLLGLHAGMLILWIFGYTTAIQVL